MAYRIDLSQLKCIIDDTPQLKRDPQPLFVMKASTEYFDANSTICECNEESEPYSFWLKFKVELKQDPITQSNEDKELYNMGSSFGVNEVDNPKNLKCSNDINDNTKSDQDDNHPIKKRSVSVQTNNLSLKNKLQLFKYNQKYSSNAVYQETLLKLKQNQRFQKFVSKNNNKNRSIHLLLLLILFIILIMCI